MKDYKAHTAKLLFEAEATNRKAGAAYRRQLSKQFRRADRVMVENLPYRDQRTLFNKKTQEFYESMRKSERLLRTVAAGRWFVLTDGDGGSLG